MFFLAINPDCSLLGYPTVRISAQPTNGVVSVFKGKAFPRFLAPNPRSACDSRRVPAMRMEYRPRRDFVGSDSFSIDVFFRSGAEQEVTVNVTVR